jgi:hypothetical protein
MDNELNNTGLEALAGRSGTSPAKASSPVPLAVTA